MIPLILFFVMSTLSDPSPNDPFFVVCKSGTNIVRLQYLDSNHGIEKIESRVAGDTVTLVVKVSIGVRNEPKEVNIPESVSFLKIGKKEFALREINPCGTILSGQEAIELLKKNKK